MREIRKGFDTIYHDRASNPDTVRQDVKVLASVGLAHAVREQRSLIAEGARIPKPTEIPARVLERLDSVGKSIDAELVPSFSSQNIRSRLDELAHDTRLLRKLAYDEGDAVAAHRKELEGRALDSKFYYEHPPATLHN